MKIVTWNIRSKWDAQDGINECMHRAGFVYEKIMREKPDVIAFQEVTQPIYDCLVRLLPEYDFFGTLRNQDYSGEGLFTAVRKEKCALLGLDIFWLSPTPYTAGSCFEEQSGCPRICVMTKIRNKSTNEVIRVLNTHLDHMFEQARVNGLQCIFGYLDGYAKTDDLPIVLLGDFNAQKDSESIQSIARNTSLVEVTNAIETTYHQFGKKTENYKIDYVYVAPCLVGRTENVVCWTDERHGIYLSDHYPVCATLKEE